MGVGNGGSNAVNYMLSQGLKDVELVVCNTDREALNSNMVPNKLQLGAALTEGLSTGSSMQKGRMAAIESQEQIRELLKHGVKMLFITAGMGGGTGSGAASVIAKIAKELGILTIGIVTVPFRFEGKRRLEQATRGIDELRKNCDATVVIPYDSLREISGRKFIRDLFTQADDIILLAVQSITQILTTTGEVHIDFEDIKAVLRDSGMAVIGSSNTEGEDRARRAVDEALMLPLLSRTSLLGAQKVLLSVMSGNQAELELEELTEMTERLQDQVGQDAEVIFGHGIDSTLGQGIRLTLIASGFPNEEFVPLENESLSSEKNQSILPYSEDSFLITPENLNSVSSFESDDLEQYANSEHYQLKIGFSIDKKTGKLTTRATENGRNSSYNALWSETKGWFSAGFGPFRRFTGGDPEYHKLFDAPQHKRLAAHLSLFKENVALTEALNWLRQLKFRSLESHGLDFLLRLKSFINQPDFLPHGTRLAEVSSEGIYFRDSSDNLIDLDELSDGFRSVLSLAFELLRQLENQYGEGIFEEVDQSGVIRVSISGVVLIDEIDAHLHPIWQKRIGYWLTKHFPHIQFFVTTHSPLVCQAAEHGSVFHLPRPGTEGLGRMVAGTELNRLIYGNVLEAYGTEVFGLVHTQSEAGQAKTSRLTDLNEQALSAELTADEQQERNTLRATLPISDSEAFVKKLLGNL
ncbi:cell division protein FtsZ [Hymenobacter radiodurans]|uniref:cell division protein FtsZ n=1 Tax=Hymenobacter radiodurans TaxID=2496028 RepID=UPI001F0DF7E5|nr:cell division protein FtsZ [Hymenobacter radiodurans]